MNQFITTLFKALGVLALSAFIFFLFLPKEQVKDQAVNLALEFLGKRLLAMVPKEHERDVEFKFEAVREQALQGKISDESLENFAAIVLNAEAEGRPLEVEEIDSALVALHESEAAVRVDEARRVEEEKRLEHFAKRMQEFEQFEKHWQTFVPDSVVKYARVARVRPLYRLSENFVVQIDSAALAQAITVHSVHVVDSVVTALPRHFPPPPPPRVQKFMRDLESDLRDLRVEWHSGDFERQWHWADSLRARAKAFRRDRRGRDTTSPEIPGIPPTPETQPPPRRN